uniref:Uncharacterized protein n=1 Tax=Magallana gigas TaxID=29159 RepID=A0A8W8M1X9_MAGGI
MRSLCADKRSLKIISCTTSTLESAILSTTYVCVVTLLGILQLAGGSQCGVLKMSQDDMYKYRLWPEHQTC